MDKLRVRLTELHALNLRLPSFTPEKDISHVASNELLLQTSHIPPLAWLDKDEGVRRDKEGEMVLALLDAGAFDRVDKLTDQIVAGTVNDVLQWVAEKCDALKHSDAMMGTDPKGSNKGLNQLRRSLSEEVLARYLIGWATKLNAHLKRLTNELFAPAEPVAAGEPAPFPHVKNAPVKALPRVLEKLGDDEKGRKPGEKLRFYAAADIRDLARFSVECSDEEQLMSCIQRLRDADWCESSHGS